MEVFYFKTEDVRNCDISWIKHIMPKRFAKAYAYKQEKDRLLCLGGPIRVVHGFIEELFQHFMGEGTLGVGFKDEVSPLVDAEAVGEESLSNIIRLL